MPALYLVQSGEMLAAYVLDQNVVVMGRGSECDIVIKGEGVSRNHCQLVRSGDNYLLQDLNSANGTYVDGEEIKAHLLKDGDKIFVCPHVLQYRAKVEVVPEVVTVPAVAEDEPETMKVDSQEIIRRLRILVDRSEDEERENNGQDGGENVGR